MAQIVESPLKPRFPRRNWEKVQLVSCHPDLTGLNFASAIFGSQLLADPQFEIHRGGFLNSLWIHGKSRLTMTKQQGLNPQLKDIFVDTIHRSLKISEGLKLEQAEAASVSRWFKHLTERELELLELIAHGQSSKQIAINLGISIKTVCNHRTNLMAKAGAANAAELSRLFTRHKSILPQRNHPHSAGNCGSRLWSMPRSIIGRGLLMKIGGRPRAAPPQASAGMGGCRPVIGTISCGGHIAAPDPILGRR
jgi:DNA-binding CsgD family transcriptional regulator